jgi:hypothetical protein
MLGKPKDLLFDLAGELPVKPVAAKRLHSFPRFSTFVGLVTPRQGPAGQGTPLALHHTPKQPWHRSAFSAKGGSQWSRPCSCIQLNSGTAVVPSLPRSASIYLQLLFSFLLLGFVSGLGGTVIA